MYLGLLKKSWIFIKTKFEFHEIYEKEMNENTFTDSAIEIVKPYQI